MNNAPEESRTRTISFERSYNPLSDGRRPTTAPIGYSLPALTGAFSGLFACPSAWTVAFGTTGGAGGDGVASEATVAAGSGLNETTATACGITRQITPWSSHAASTPDERTGHLGIGKTGLVHPSASASWIPSLRIPGNDRKRRRSQRPRLFHTPAGCSTCRRFSAAPIRSIRVILKPHGFAVVDRPDVGKRHVQLHACFFSAPPWKCPVTRTWSPASRNWSALRVESVEFLRCGLDHLRRTASGPWCVPLNHKSGTSGSIHSICGSSVTLAKSPSRRTINVTHRLDGAFRHGPIPYSSLRQYTKIAPP